MANWGGFWAQSQLPQINPKQSEATQYHHNDMQKGSNDWTFNRMSHLDTKNEANASSLKHILWVVMCEITLEIYLKKFKYSVFIIFRQTSFHSDHIGDDGAWGVETITHLLDASFDLVARCNCVPFALNWQEIARWHVGSHGGITVLPGDNIRGARSGGWRVEMAGEVGDDICIKSQTPQHPVTSLKRTSNKRSNHDECTVSHSELRS